MIDLSGRRLTTSTSGKIVLARSIRWVSVNGKSIIRPSRFIAARLARVRVRRSDGEEALAARGALVLRLLARPDALLDRRCLRVRRDAALGARGDRIAHRDGPRDRDVR